MKCPYCGYSDSKVIDSRPTDEGKQIRRRRECLSCAKRFTTYETIETVPIVIVKKDGSRQQFDRDKIRNGIMRACEKRPVSMDAIESTVDEVEQRLQNTLDREITSTMVGEYVMEALKKLDEVAYVRFASVYKEFRDIESFEKEFILLRKKTGEEK